MNDITISLPKHLAIIIAIVIIAITLGGYTLFFHSQSQAGSKEREFELLKEKQMHSEENYNDLQKKFYKSNDELKQINKDYEAALQKQQEYKEKSDMLQANFESLQQTNLLLQKSLNEAQSKLGIKSTLGNSTPSSTTSPSTSTSTTTSESIQ